MPFPGRSDREPPAASSGQGGMAWSRGLRANARFNSVRRVLDALDLSTERLQLEIESLVTAIEVVDTPNRRLALRSQASDDKGRAGPQVGRHDTRSGQSSSS